MSALVLSIALHGVALADFDVVSGNTAIRPGALDINVRSELALSEPVEEALNSGIAIHLLYQIRLYRIRPVIWDDQLGEWSLGFTLKYQALSSGYVLTDDQSGELETFVSIREAMDSLSNLSFSIPVITDTLPDTEAGYRVSMRILMDRKTLPSPLKLVADISPEWKLDSAWQQWTVDE